MLGFFFAVATLRRKELKMVIKKNNERWLGYGEAADYVGCTERQLKRWVSQGRVPHTKLGLRVQFTREYLDAFIEAQTRGPNYKDRAG